MTATDQGGSHMRKFVVVIVLAALAAGFAASPASAGRRLTGNGSGNNWVVFLKTPIFFSESGLIDIWYTCRPKSNNSRLKLVLTRTNGQERPFNVPCDRAWIQNIVTARDSHYVRAEIYGGQAMGYTSVYEGH
jgi:hypothetical protein